MHTHTHTRTHTHTHVHSHTHTRAHKHTHTPVQVLVIGGGDGGLAREVCKHSTVEEVHVCEIDEVPIHKILAIQSWNRYNNTTIIY